MGKGKHDGPAFGPDITRLSATEFNLTSTGIYEVSWQACSINPSLGGDIYFGLVLNGTFLFETLAGPGTTLNGQQLMNDVLIDTTTPNSVLSAFVLGQVSFAATTPPVTAWLMITRLQ